MKNFNGYPHIFGVQEHNAYSPDTVRRNRKSEFKDGGPQTGSTYISACILDSNAISTATPIFAGSRNTKRSVRTLSDVTGSRNSKMAATKPEVLISRLVYYIATRFQRLPPYLRGPGTQSAQSGHCPT
jgi:hypothetical protein